jgi:glycosyltransferase involved in cell wall biosynthesis
MRPHKRLKLGLIVPGFSANEQDWCIPALLDMVRELAAAHEVHVFTLRYPHQRRTYSVYGATVHALGGATAGGLRRLPLLVSAFRHIQREAKNGNFDMLHGLWADEPGLVAVIAARWLGIPAIVSMLGGELIAMPEIGYGHQLSRAAHWMIDLSLRMATQVTVGSNYLQQIALRKVSSERLSVCPLGVDTTLFVLGDAPIALAGDFRLLHVASLSPIKGQAMLLRAFAQVQAVMPNAHLHLVGDGVLRPSLQTLAIELGIDKQITFHGDVPHHALPAYYQAADLCVLTSHYESQSMVVLEAAACGRLTVGTRVGVLQELIPSTLQVEPGDAQSLAPAIIRLAQDSALRERLSQQVHEQVVRQYSLNASITRWALLYNSQ